MVDGKIPIACIGDSTVVSGGVDVPIVGVCAAVAHNVLSNSVRNYGTVKGNFNEAHSCHLCLFPVD